MEQVKSLIYLFIFFEAVYHCINIGTFIYLFFLQLIIGSKGCIYVIVQHAKDHIVLKQGFRALKTHCGNYDKMINMLTVFVIYLFIFE